MASCGLLNVAATALVPSYPPCPQTVISRSDHLLPPPCLQKMWHLAAGPRTSTHPSPPTMSLPARVMWGLARTSLPVRPGPCLLDCAKFVARLRTHINFDRHLLAEPLAPSTTYSSTSRLLFGLNHAPQALSRRNVSPAPEGTEPARTVTRRRMYDP